MLQKYVIEESVSKNVIGTLKCVRSELETNYCQLNNLYMCNLKLKTHSYR